MRGATGLMPGQRVAGVTTTWPTTWPPAWLCAGDVELFRDEIAAYAELLRAAGVDATSLEIPGGAHGFENRAPEAEPTGRLLAAVRDRLAERLGGPREEA
jgi:acetyl esterase/lipase